MMKKSTLWWFPFLIGIGAVSAFASEAVQDLFKKSDCMACHAPDKTVVGPSFKEIAARYTEKDIPTLVSKVKTGGSGNWGVMPMIPHPTLAEADLQKMVGWILSSYKPGAETPGPKIVPGTKPGEAPEYRRFPIIGSRVAVWIAAQLHLMFAAFVLAVPLFALIIEFIGYKTKDEKYDHLAHEFTKLLSTSFSFTASLGALLTFLLIYLYPTFMNYFMGIFGWTFAPYAALFFAEAGFLYSYYYGWGKFSPRTHLLLGLGLNLVGTAIIFIADAWLTFMMSPNGLTEAGELINRWAAFANFTWMPINVHRMIANVAFGGSIAAAYGAFKFLGAKTDEERAHYDWMGYIGNFIAIAAFLPLPFAGYWLGKEIYAYSQNMGMTLMGGAFSWLFIIQAVLIGVLFLAGNYYLWLGMGRIKGAERYRSFVKWLLASITLCVLVWATPHSLVATVEEARKMGGAHHPFLGVLGVMSAKNTAVNILILTTYMSFLLYRRGNKVPTVSWAKWGKVAQTALFVLACVIVIALGVYGYFVEATVRIKLSVPQVLTVIGTMATVTVIDIFLFGKARILGAIQWGKMPVRSQYALFLIAITFTWTMALMGYARSGIRQHWHVYGVMRDTSPDAFTPTLGFAANVVSVTVLIFFLFIAAVFWLSGLSTREAWRADKPKVEKKKGSSRYVLHLVLFTIAVTGFYTYVGHLVPQKRVDPPQEVNIRPDMTTDEMVDMGKTIVEGKGTCLSCHTMGATSMGRFPDLAGIGGRAKSRKPGFSDVDYLAESLYEPMAYIVPGYNPGMPNINKAPVNLSDGEILCVLAYLQSLGGTPTVTMKTKLKYQTSDPSAAGRP